MIGNFPANDTSHCVTRRSAGLPHLVGAILATEPKTRNRKLFHEVLRQLLEIARTQIQCQGLKMAIPNWYLDFLH